MVDFFNKWCVGSVTVKNVVSVITPGTGSRVKNCGNTEAYQLGIKFSGRSELCYRGNRIDLSRGVVAYLPKEQTVDIDYTTTFIDGGDGVCIFFDTDAPMPDEPRAIVGVGEDVERAFLRILDLYVGGGSYPDMMEAFWGLVARLSRVKSAEGDAITRLSDRLRPAIRYMDENPGAAFVDIAELGEKCSMTEKYFRSVFKSCMGVSPLQYFHSRKAEYMRSLISNLDLSISDIGRMCGFTDANYFSRFFRKHLGLSPRQYRSYYCKRL